MKPVWSPTQERINNSRLHHYQQFLKSLGHHCNDYASLWRWSVDEPSAFWASLWQYFDIIHHSPYQQVIRKTGPSFYDIRWFEGSTLNFAENLLRNNSNKLALSFINEQGQKSSISYADLHKKTGQLANQMRQQGITKGERIAGLMPNCIETVIAMLATASIGAIWSSCSPDFGLQGIIDRFGQIKPKWLFSVNGYFYNGKTHSCLDKIDALCQQLEDLEQVVLHPFCDQSGSLINNPKICDFNELLTGHGKLSFEAVPFDHPLYIMYSSGTTGTPKCIVHSVGGTLLQHLKELALHTDLKADDKIFFFTTCGWMMWNWLISSLALSAEVFLYDGSPSFGQSDNLLKIVDEHQITIFGCGAKYLDLVEKSACKPNQHHAFDSLKTILSTGSPLAPHSFDYVYNHIKSDLQLSSISGGTDIISCFALGCPTLPVYRGELQCLGLGMDVDVYDSNGQPLANQKGELVCKSPFPSMPIYFWHDHHNSKYHQAYFNRFNNCWAHGDYAELTKHQGLIIHGRSDAVLNPGGVRIGTAEIYRQVEKIEQVVDCVVIGQPWQGDERIILFVQLQQGLILDDSLTLAIKRFIRTNTTPRHTPAKVVQVSEIPKTISGKVVELTVKKVICDEPITNLDALANPQALADFKNRPELLTD